MSKCLRTRVFVWAMLLTLAAGGLPAVAFAQVPTGNIEGNVTDAQGGILSGATVEITQEGTGFARSVTTDNDGSYRLSGLQPGNYNVTISAAGFKKSLADNVTVAVGQTTPLDVQLSVGGAEETIEVAGGEATVDRTDSKVDGVVTPLQIANLPLNGRNFLDLARLQPGAETVDGASFDPTKANYTGVSLGGQAGRSTQISVDGGSVVDNAVGTTVQNFSQEIISEFQVGISNVDVSTGASASGSVNVLTKSGSNDFHGNGYIYYRDDQFGAFPGLTRLVDPDQSDGSVPYQARRVQFDREQLGGSFGGPIKKDSMFFFFNLEYNNQDSVSIFNIPNPAVVGFNGIAGQPFNELLVSARYDWRISQNHTLFGRYSHDDNDQIAPFPIATGIVPRESQSGIFSSNSQYSTNRADGFVIGFTSVLAPTLVNDLRYSFNDFTNNVLRDPSTPEGVPEIRIIEADASQIWRAGGNGIVPQVTLQNRNQIRDDITWTAGNHTLRAGIDFERSSIGGRFALFKPGRIRIFGPTAVPGLMLATEEDFLNAPVRDFRLGVGSDLLPFNDPSGKTINYRWQPYVNDNWKIHPRLTLGLGLAYRYDSNLWNTDLSRPAIIAPVFNRGTAPSQNDTNNWAPRVGFAWDIAGDAKTVIRGSAGIYYDTTVDNLRLFERADLGPPGALLDLAGTQIVSSLLPGGDGSFGTTPGSASGYLTLREALAILPALRADLESRAFNTTAPTSVEAFRQVSGPILSSDFQVPYAIQYSFGLQRELPWNMLLQADLNYRKGLHEVLPYDINKSTVVDRFGNPMPLLPIDQWGDGGAPTALPYVDSSAFSVYRALLVRVDKRFSDDWQFTASYALSRINSFFNDTLGLGSSDAYGLIDLNNLRANYGPSALDRTHRFVFSALYYLPRYTGDSAWKKGLLDGWSASVISTTQSGIPLTAVLPDNLNLSGASDGSATGIFTSLLPGTRAGSLGRDISTVDELNSLITAYNSNLTAYAARLDGGVPVDPYGTPLRALALLPAGTQIGGDSLISQDVRVTKAFYFNETTRIDLIAEAFNLFNVSNLIGAQNFPNLVAQGDVDDWNNNVGGVNPGRLPFPNYPFQPNGRVNNIFGAGGPRAFQFAAKFVF
jgi:hypothetical protein